MNFMSWSAKMVEPLNLKVKDGTSVSFANFPATSISKGMLKSWVKLARDVLKNKWRLGILKDTENKIWSRSVNHNASKGEEVICCLDAAKKSISLAIMDSTGALRQYDETHRCPYEVFFTLIGYFWELNTVDYKVYDPSIDYVWKDIRSDINSIIREYEKTDTIDESDALTRMTMLLFRVGREVFNQEVSDFEEVRALPTQGTDITRQMFPELKSTVFFLDEAVAQDTAKVEKNEEIFKRLEKKALKVFASYHKTLTDEQRAHIPKHRDDYIFTEDVVDSLEIALANIERGEANTNLLFKSEPGTGKTAAAIEIAAICHIPVYIEQGYDSKDAGDYCGTTIATNGVLHTDTNTPFVKWATGGGVFIDDDVNYAKCGEGVFKNSMLERPYSCRLANQTEIKRNPFSIYIATANPDVAGARELSPAFISRMMIVVNFKMPQQKDLEDYLIFASGVGNRPFVTKVIELGNAINAAIGFGYDKKEEAERLTMRHLINFLKAYKEKGNPLRAAELTIIPSLCASQAFEETVRQTYVIPRFANSKK